MWATTGADALLLVDYSRGRAPAAQASAPVSLGIIFLFCLFVLFFLAVELVFSDASIFYISCLAAVVFVYVPVLI